MYDKCCFLKKITHVSLKHQHIAVHQVELFMEGGRLFRVSLSNLFTVFYLIFLICFHSYGHVDNMVSSLSNRMYKIKCSIQDYNKIRCTRFTLFCYLNTAILTNWFVNNFTLLRLIKCLFSLALSKF